MSTLKVTNIQHPSAADPAIELNADGGALIGGQAAYARNLLYNGAMQVHQRGTSSTGITGTGYNTADRWNSTLNAGTWTQTLENDAPTGSGLRKSIKLLCTTAKGSLAAGDFFEFRQALEGQDLQRIAKGTASAQQITMSFWVKSNVTGTYICELYDDDNTRQVSASYTISASATWEKKVITFPADTIGAFDNDNAGSLYVIWYLLAGSNRTSGTLNTVWATPTTANRAVGQTNLASATNNYWQITGVQLEVGPVATPFEFKSYGQELAECQRYYWRNVGSTNYSSYGAGTAQSTTNVLIHVQFPVPMRAAPTSVTGVNVGVGDGQNFPLTPSSINIDQSSPDAALLGFVVTGATQYRPHLAIGINNATNSLAMSAEL